jgi:hypothetical protein
MEESKSGQMAPTEPERVDVQSLVKQAVEEYTRTQQADAEPAYRAELQEERRRREQLERRVNDLIEESKRSRQIADEAERSAAIRAELQRLGVGKVDLAFKAVKDDIARTDEGRLVARTEFGEVALKDYLTSFVISNPEFLPARISGGSGIPVTQKSPSGGSTSIDLDKIRPGMSAEDLNSARQEIARVAAQALRGS